MAPLLTGVLFRPDRYHYFAELDSTNRLAARLAQEGADQGTVVVADCQTGGRGRLGRSWFSPRGVNLYCSVVLRPAIPPQVAAQLTLVAGLALAHAVADLGCGDVELKWPNDLLLGGRKAAGILTEMRTEAARIQHVIVGIGVNVNGARTAFPVALREQAVNLAESLRGPVDRARLLAGLLAWLEHWYDRFDREGFGPLRQEWLSFARLLDQAVQVRLADETFSGRARALDAEGYLLVQRADGTLTRVVAGDVMRLEEG
ncbi:MAG: biotin--[acetyl-CoA-carboxylase] ligase [Magnetococcus sp. DMHC-8]